VSFAAKEASAFWAVERRAYEYAAIERAADVRESARMLTPHPRNEVQAECLFGCGPIDYGEQCPRCEEKQ
jgi:hypothetical protein